MAFFLVSFLTAPAPDYLAPGNGIPRNAAWIVAVLLGTILTLFALQGHQDQQGAGNSNNGALHGLQGQQGIGNTSTRSLEGHQDQQGVGDTIPDQQEEDAANRDIEAAEDAANRDIEAAEDATNTDTEQPEASQLTPLMDKGKSKVIQR